MSDAGPNGTGLGPDEEWDVLIGEYVLGTLEPAEAQAVAERASRDATWAAAIAAWEARLAPMARLADASPPPAALWDRIADSAGLRESLKTAAAPQPAPQQRWVVALWENVALWRWMTGASLAAATALLALALLRPPAEPHQATALLPAGSGTAAFLVEELPRGGLQVRSVVPVSVAPGRDLELWALPPGATRPVTLGVIPADAQRLLVPHPEVRLAERTQFMVSLEPKGGSPTGQPSGPVLLAGTLGN